jgi:hypothetical protein
MQQDHRPWDEKSFQAGANTDADGVSVANTPGMYRDARNMRIADNAGNNGALKKIGGETLLYNSDVPGADSYVCIGAIHVKGHKVEFWASNSSLYPPLIRIDGTIMVMSDQLPYHFSRKLQLHKSEDCAGGKVFDARSGTIPLHWDIQHIIDAFNAGEQTYFGGFDLSSVQVNPTRPVNRPVFRGFTSVGNGAGLAGGQIWYATRLVNATGDRTPDGPLNGPVMVPFTTGGNEESVTVPSASISGAGLLELNQATGLGAKLVFRVNNTANFDSVELVRMRWSDQAGVDALPVIEVAYRQAIGPGENIVIPMVDDGTTLEPIPGGDNAIVTYFIEEANSVRYVDYRLTYGGVVLGGQDVTGTFNDEAGERLIPFTKNLGTKGHADPVNHCYYRRFQSGERHGIGVVYYGPNGGQSFVQPVEEEVQLPSRRTPKAGASLALSDAPCYAADINGQVGPTFEVFDHDKAIGKSRTNPLVNIMVDGRRRIGGWSSESVLAGTPDGITEDGVYVDDVPFGPWHKSSWLKPLTPVRPADWKWGLDYRVNTKVHPSGQANATDAGAQEYDPKVWGVEHHTLGLGFTGLTSAPPGMQGFSVVATPPAGRVVTQGILKWKLNPATSGSSPTPVSKDLFSAHLCLPDFNAGTVNQEVWEGLQNNPGKYQLQCVSPLGISTEQYGSVMSAQSAGLDDNAQHVGGFSDLADLLSVVRVLWDTGQINPGSNAGGFSPASALPVAPSSGTAPDHFAGFGAWRNLAGSWSFAEGGDHLFTIQSGQEVVHASGVRSMLVNLDGQLYHSSSVGFDAAFNGSPCQDFCEPWYVVNIIAEGKHPDLTRGFGSLNHYQAFISAIGTTDGTGGQSLRLVDENADLVQGAGEKYVYVRGSGGTLRLLNAANFGGSLSEIQSDIAAQGFWTAPSGNPIHGLYTTEEVDGDLHVVLGSSGTPPLAAGGTVEVRYDFGTVKCYGDMVTAPSLATLVDAAATANPPNGVPSLLVGTQSGGNNSIPAWPIWSQAWFDYGGSLITNGSLPVPFANYEYNGRYMVPFGGTNGIYDVLGGTTPGTRLSVNQIRSGALISIRQWKVLFDCEVRAPVFLSRYELNGERSWPNVNYIPRPYNFTSGDPGASGVFPNYGDNSLYGPNEQSSWRFGGIKSAQHPTTDYILVPAVRYFAKPEFGYEEQTDQCNAFLWSANDSPLLQDSPGLKTFPVANIEFIPNTGGGIQRLYSPSGGNVFAVMEHAVYEILISKSTAYSADGTAFSMYAQDNFVGQVVPRSMTIGMPGDTWKTAAEGAPYIQGGAQADALMWYNGTSAFMLVGGTVQDIAIGSYRKGLAGSYYGNGIAKQTPITAAYDQEKNELWFLMGEEVCVYNASALAMKWQGKYDHRFDELLFAGGKMYGMRDLRTYVLDTGDTINGALINAWVKVASAPTPTQRMQWLMVKAVSRRKPKRIEWYDENDTLVAWMDEATFGPKYLKYQSGGYENWVPQKNATLFQKKGHLQGGLAYYKVIFEEGGEDVVRMSGTQVKTVRG